MLPSVVASELEQVAADAIRTAFHPTTPGFRELIDRFLADRERLLKGPYVSVALPFHQGDGRDWFPQIPLPFPPYRHQQKAFDRLLPGTPLDPAMRDTILLITILVAFLEAAAQQLRPQAPVVVMGFGGIHANRAVGGSQT